MKKSIIFILVILLMLTGCYDSEVSNQEDTQIQDTFQDELSQIIEGNTTIPQFKNQTIENLYAFTKLYGYIRFFHPSKETDNFKWDEFAVYGASYVKDAKDDNELKNRLEELFLPIAPKIKINTNVNLTHIYPDEELDESILAWQHYGVSINDSKFDTIYSSSKTMMVNKMFEAFPEMGEIYKAQISSELYGYIPVALYLSDALPNEVEFSEEYISLCDKLDGIDINTLSATNQDVRLADVVITWNVLQHFFPYFEVLDVDWEKELVATLNNSLPDQSSKEFSEVLNKMLVPLEDGHAICAYLDELKNNGVLPIELDLVENQIVVINSNTPLLEPGDIIISINGADALENLKEREKLISGSPHFKQSRALLLISVGAKDEKVKFKVMRNELIEEVELTYSKSVSLDFNKGPKDFEEIEEGIYYISLSTDSITVLDKHIEELKNAKGVIFDNRGYPSADVRLLLQYIIDEKVQTPPYKVMNNIYPDRIKYDYDDRTLDYLPNEGNKIAGKKVFLIDSPAISFAENIPSIVHHYNLGELVGHPTAGSNGNINLYDLPGGYIIRHTGMKVTNHDGSQFHGIGVQPTYYVELTIEGIRDGRDEFIEKAIEIIKGN